MLILNHFLNCYGTAISSKILPITHFSNSISFPLATTSQLVPSIVRVTFTSAINRPPKVVAPQTTFF